jgi:predicted MFS family arabinose efflux permease
VSVSAGEPLPSAAISPGRRRRGGELFGHRDFRLLWFGQTISDVGTSVSIVVVPLVAVVYLHASAFEVGVLSALEWLPWLLIGLPAGVWVDRSRRRPLMVSCDIVRTALVASIPVAAAFDALTIGQLLAVAFGTGVATVLFQVAYQAYLPALVVEEHLAEGNAKLQGSQAAANILGPGIGGLLAQAVRAPFALVVDAASYLVSAVALRAIGVDEPGPEAAQRRSVRAEIAEGGRFVVHDPFLRTMTISPALGNFCFIGYQSISVLFLVRTVHVTAGVVGVLLAISSVGSIVGAALARPIARAVGTSRALWGSIVLSAPFGLLIPLTGRGAGLLCFVAGNFLMFTGILVYNVTISSFRQAYCPPAMLGRVVASMRFVLFGSMPLGSLLGGVLAQTIGTREALWVLLGANVVLPTLVLLTSPLIATRDLPSRPA